MSTAFQNQGCQMNLELAGTEIPVSALNCFDTLSILTLVPVFDQVLYPYCKKIGYPLTMLQKIGKAPYDLLYCALS
jgi:dipeptide/tripeptide permease